MSVAAIAVGWGGNLNAFLDAAFGVALPDAIAKSPEDGGIFNLPAVFIVLAITLLLVRGVTESARVNLVMVGDQAGRAGVLHRGGAGQLRHRQLPRRSPRPGSTG